MPFSFEALDVYGKAAAFGVYTLELTRRFPEEYSALTGELDRAAISVSSKIAGGASIWEKSKKKELFYAARDSCVTCAAMFSLSKTLGLVDESEMVAVSEQVETISKMVTKLAQSVDKERSKPQVSSVGS